jgi:hypothetical protein
MGQEINKPNPQAWFDRERLQARKLMMDCEVYEHPEVMP